MDDQKRSQLLDNYDDTTSAAPPPNSPIVPNEKDTTQPDLRTHKKGRKDKTTQGISHKTTRTRSKTTGAVSRKKRLIRIAASTFVSLLVGFILFTIWYMFYAVQPVTVFQVGKKGLATSYVGGGGILAPMQTYPVIYPFAERATGILVKPGDSVKPNQPLVKLDPNELNATLTEASNALNAAQTYYNAVANTALNPVAVAAALQNLNIARSHYQALQAQSDSDVLRGSSLISTVSGVVSAINVNPGQSFAANTTLLTIVDQSSVVMQAKIPLENIGLIHRGDIAQVSPSAQPNLTVQGTVDSILPVADPQTDTVTVLVVVKNQQQQLVTGMSATVRIATKESAYVVPRLAVLNPDRESSVFVVRNNIAYMEQVHVIGLGTTPNTYLVDSGLNPNDQIILLPLNRIHNGRQVDVTTIDH